MTTLRVAAVQISSGADPQANLDLVAERVAEAAARGARLVVFPEATMRRFGLPLAPVAEEPDGPWAAGLRAVAERHEVVVVAGMFGPAPDGRVVNALRAVGPGVDATYAKIHLYDAFGFRESDTVAPGEDLVLIEVDGVRVGLTTCYDVRFPGLYTALAEAGARLVVVAASWGAGPGKVSQWQLLTRARALDCTCFLLAAGQAVPGESEVGSTAPLGVGHTVAVSPWGEVLDELDERPGVLIADLELAEVERARAALPVLANRRR